MKLHRLISIFFISLFFLFTLSQNAQAQGQDSLPAERDILVMQEMLGGYYSNANQAYFDVRLKQPVADRHASANWQVEAVDYPKLGAQVFSVEQKIGEELRHMLISFSVDFDKEKVRMRTYELESAFDTKNAAPKYIMNCDLLWRQEAGQFHGVLESESCAANWAPRDMMLAPESIWVNFKAVNKLEHGGHYAMDKARDFSCYADVPGVGGGRDIPFERYRLEGMHDMGSEKWFTTKDGQEVGVNLFKVMWTFNNYEGAFARPSLVVYVKTKSDNPDSEEQSTTEVSYAWTAANAQRVGINLKWVLVNCYMLSNEDVTPFFKNDEPRL